MPKLFIIALSLVVWSGVLPLAFCQAIIISTDTTSLSDCEQFHGTVGTVHLYNNTDQDIGLHWQVLDFTGPPGSRYAIVILGIQNPPYISEGLVGFESHVTDSVMFYFFHDQWAPGDSAILHFKIADAKDEVNTQQFITVIQHCPLSTSTQSPQVSNDLRLYPNPAHQSTTLYLNEAWPVSSVELYSISGQHVQHIPVTNQMLTIDRQQLPAGFYLVRAMQNEKCVSFNKLIFY